MLPAAVTVKSRDVNVMSENEGCVKGDYEREVLQSTLYVMHTALRACNNNR